MNHKGHLFQVTQFTFTQPTRVQWKQGFDSLEKILFVADKEQELVKHSVD